MVGHFRLAEGQVLQAVSIPRSFSRRTMILFLVLRSTRGLFMHFLNVLYFVFPSLALSSALLQVCDVWNASGTFSHMYSLPTSLLLKLLLTPRSSSLCLTFERSAYRPEVSRASPCPILNHPIPMFLYIPSYVPTFNALSNSTLFTFLYTTALHES